MSESSATSKSQTSAASTPKPSSTLNTGYLILYNLVSATLWLTVLGRVVSVLVLMQRTDMVFNITAEFTKWTQTLALLEVLHALLGPLPGFSLASKLTLLNLRHCPSTCFYYCNAGYEPAFHCLGHCRPIPIYRRRQSCVFHNAPRVERYGGRSLHFLCVPPFGNGSGCFTVAKVRLASTRSEANAHKRPDITPSSFCILSASPAKLGWCIRRARPLGREILFISMLCGQFSPSTYQVRGNATFQ